MQIGIIEKQEKKKRKMNAREKHRKYINRRRRKNEPKQIKTVQEESKEDMEKIMIHINSL